MQSVRLCLRTFVSLLCSVLLFVTSASADFGIVEFPAVGPYNGFLNQQNIVECVNFGNEQARVRITVTRFTGALVGSSAHDIAAKGTTHIILNAMSDGQGVGITNDIGTYTLERLDSNFDVKISCMTVFYRYLPGTNQPNYAFMVPVKSSLVGDSFGLYNSFDPAGLVPTNNWLTLYNPNTVGNISGRVRIYRQDGSLNSNVSYTLEPGKRQDIPLGHPEGMFTGIYVIEPDDNTPYESFLARYNPRADGNYNFAFSQLTTNGSCGETLPVSISGNGGNTTTNWLEMGNPSATPQTVTVTFRDFLGALLHQEQRTIPARSQDNVFVNTHYGQNGAANAGTVNVTCDDPEAKLILQTAFYGKESAAATTFSWAYVSQGRGAPSAEQNDALVGSMNTFLAADNWLNIINRNGNNPSVSTSVYNQVGQLLNASNYTIPNVGASYYAAHADSQPNALSTVGSGTTAANSALTGELNRVYRDQNGNIVEIMPTPLAVISEGLACLNGGCASQDFAGDSESLMPYRDDLNPAEVRHFLRKVALGGSEDLYNIGVNQGLEALINALINYQEPFNVDSYALEVAETAFSNGRWTEDAGQYYWLTHLRYGNPLKERMAMIWHDHMSTSIAPYSGREESHQFVKDHIDILRQYAMGNFRTFVKELFWDRANASELNLDDNWCGVLDESGDEACNENYPREYFELLLMGTNDPYSGKANYTEEDVQKGFSYALSGFHTINLPGELPTVISWSPDSWYSGTFPVFEGTPFYTVASFNYDTFTDYVMQVHTQVPRYIAYSLLSRLLGIKPTQQQVSIIANNLRQNDYNIELAIRPILRSQAMFSLPTRKSCVASPVEVLMNVMRNFDLPLNREDEDVYRHAEDYITETGHELLDPTTVFGFGECFGHTGPEDGSSFLSAQRHLEGIYRNMMSILNEVDDVIDDGGLTTFTWASLLPSLTATPTQIVDSMAARLDISLSQNERNKLVEYLNYRYDYIGDPDPHPTVWDPLDEDFSRLVELKIPGLITILQSHPDSLTK